MTDFFDDDDDTGFWEQRSEPTIQLDRIGRRSPERTRTHRVVERDATPTGAHRRTTSPGSSSVAPGDLYEDGSIDHDMIWVEPLARRHRRVVAGSGLFGSIDPRLLSVGAIALAAVLAVPLFGALGKDGDEDSFRSVVEAESTTTVAPTSTAPSTTAVVITAALTPVPTDAPRQLESDDEGGSSDGQSTATGGNAATAEVAAPSDDENDSGSSGGGPAGLAAPAVRVAAQCGNPYEVQGGDYWMGIAAAIDVSVDDLLDYNEATGETPIYPGSIVCLPLGTSVAPPTTEAPATTAAPTEPATTVAPATTEPATTQAPQSTQPATTQAPQTTEVATTQPPRNDGGGDQDDDDGGIPLPTNAVPNGGAVEQMIRDIWPDDLEDQALRIAWRESNYRPDVTSSTGCCLGVFQIHWESHQGWLSGLGVTSRSQLFDAQTNIRAAYALYQQAGGWGPWQ